MAKLTILNNEFATMWFYTDTKTLHHKMKKFAYGANMQELLNKGTESIQKYSAQKWISDNRNNGPFTKVDQMWANNIWIPYTAKYGWKYWAIVQPKSILGQKSEEGSAMAITHCGVTIATFIDVNFATHWLEKQS
jgi:hypothetical protein